MESQSSATGPIWRDAFVSLAIELAPLFVALVLAVQALAALAILARRLAGAVGVAASPVWPVALVVLAAMLAVAARGAWFASHRRASGETAKWFVVLLPLVALLTTAGVLSTRGMPVAVVALLWLIVAGEELVTLRFVRARWARPWPTGLPRPHWRRAPADEVGSRYRLDQPSEAPACPDDCVQRIQRVQPADGSDVLWGLLTTRLLPGQATAHVHVAFCPPFARVPRVEYRQVSGPAARIKLGQLLPHGARFDVKRTTDGTSQIVLEVRAVHDPHGD